MTISTTDKEAQTTGVKIVVYGGAGMGKTMLAATAPAPLILSNERGLSSLTRANVLRVFGEDRCNTIKLPLPVLKIETETDLDAAIKFIVSDSRMRAIQTIYLDSLSEFAEMILVARKKRNRDGRKAYGETIDRVTAWLKKFRDLEGFNIVFVVKEATQVHNGLTKYCAQMPGEKLAEAVPYLVDEVFRLTQRDFDGTLYRGLVTRVSDDEVAKDRSGTLEEFEPPDLAAIIGKIKQG